MSKVLKCRVRGERISCRLDDEVFPAMPIGNALFDVTTINNLEEVKPIVTKRISSIELRADDESEIFCNEEFGKYGLELRCRAEGKHTPDFPETWEWIAELDEIKETPVEKREFVQAIFDRVVEESFPDVKDRMDYLKVYVVPKLKEVNAGAITHFQSAEDKWLPVYIGINPDNLEETEEDKVARDLLVLDLIHALTHVERGLKGEFKEEVGLDEGGTYAEALARGDWAVRTRYPFPHGEVESVVYVERCILPKQYCFETLKEARDFEEFNYELITGEEKPKPVTPESPKWDEIEARIPIAPVVDMLRAMKGGYNPLRDASEYWVLGTSPSGRKYLYHISDLHFDKEELEFVEVIEGIDELDVLRGEEDIEKVWDHP